MILEFDDPWKGKVTDAEKTRYKKIKTEFDRRKMIGTGRFDPEGAKHGVTGGTTPKGLPQI